jgi:hypothetical protein
MDSRRRDKGKACGSVHISYAGAFVSSPRDEARSSVFRKLSHVELSYGFAGLLMLGNISVISESFHLL